MKKRHALFSITFLISLLGFYGCSSNQKDKEDKFWSWFAKNQDYYYDQESNKDGNYSDLTEKLNEIDSNLVYEFSPIHDNGIKELTISADGLKESFPSVIKLVEKAPKIKKWKINAFRQRVPGDHLKILYDDTISIAYDDIYFTHKEENDKLKIELYIKNYKAESSFDNAVFILLDQLIGEYDTETQLGLIERKRLDETKIDPLYKFVRLREVVDSFKRRNKK